MLDLDQAESELEALTLAIRHRGDNPATIEAIKAAALLDIAASLRVMLTPIETTELEGVPLEVTPELVAVFENTLHPDLEVGNLEREHLATGLAAVFAKLAEGAPVIEVDEPTEPASVIIGVGDWVSPRPTPNGAAQRDFIAQVLDVELREDEPAVKVEGLGWLWADGLVVVDAPEPIATEEPPTLDEFTDSLDSDFDGTTAPDAFAALKGKGKKGAKP
jgi:hypothetical protein